MTPLPIVWQRLVSPEGKTCERCAATAEVMQRAISRLEQVLEPLGIEPTLETREIDPVSLVRFNSVLLTKGAIAQFEEMLG